MDKNDIPLELNIITFKVCNTETGTHAGRPVVWNGMHQCHAILVGTNRKGEKVERERESEGGRRGKESGRGQKREGGRERERGGERESIAMRASSTRPWKGSLCWNKGRAPVLVLRALFLFLKFFKVKSAHAINFTRKFQKKKINSGRQLHF